MVRHQAPRMNHQTLIVNKVIESVHYHLFVHGTDEYIYPVNRIESGKKTGLPAVSMVIAIIHFLTET